MTERDTKQASQTVSEFRNIADWWNNASTEENNYSVIKHRNKVVLDYVEQTGNDKCFLDVGCGTGQLVIDVAKLGLAAHGIDISPEMISHCENNMAKENVSPSFYLSSFFDYNFAKSSYHVVSALGFIEYISPNELTDFLNDTHKILKSSGTILLGSRNRLFNVVSMNSFTSIELELNNLENLIKQSIVVQSNVDQQAVISALIELADIEPQPTEHPHTGIKVGRRYQYSPAELCLRLARLGFNPTKLIPINYHGLPLSMIEEHRHIYERNALYMADYGLNDHRLIPNSSTFIVAAEKI